MSGLLTNLNAIKSISQLDELTIKYTSDVEAIKSQNISTIISVDGYIDELYQDDRVHLGEEDISAIYCEVSIPDSTGRTSKKVNVSKFINTLNDILYTLCKDSNAGALSKAEASCLYVPWFLSSSYPGHNGQVTHTDRWIEGPITIIPSTKSDNKTATSLTIKDHLDANKNNSEYISQLLNVESEAKFQNPVQFTSLVTAASCYIDDSLSAKNLSCRVNGCFETVLSAKTISSDNLIAPSLKACKVGEEDVVAVDYLSCSTGKVESSLSVSGNIILTGANSAIQAGIGDDPPQLKNNNGSLLATKLAVGDQSKITNSSCPAVLSVYGEADVVGILSVATKKLDGNNDMYGNCIVPNLTASNTKLLETTSCPKFISYAYTLTASGIGDIPDDLTGGNNTNAGLNIKYGVYQSSGYAQLTAQAACWS